MIGTVGFDILKLLKCLQNCYLRCYPSCLQLRPLRGGNSWSLLAPLSPGPTQWSGAQPIRGRHSSQLTNQRRRLSLPSLAVQKRNKPAFAGRGKHLIRSRFLLRQHVKPVQVAGLVTAQQLCNKGAFFRLMQDHTLHPPKQSIVTGNKSSDAFQQHLLDPILT